MKPRKGEGGTLFNESRRPCSFMINRRFPNQHFTIKILGFANSDRYLCRVEASWSTPMDFSPHDIRGAMFLFLRNKFFGSHFVLTSTSRS
jgi:hypothetical protein